MTRILELPEQVYDALIEAARSGGDEPAEWIASHLPSPPRRHGTEAERQAARELLRAATFDLGHATGTDNEQIDADQAAGLARLLQFAGTVSLGHPTRTDNEQIDADLARAYSDTHDDIQQTG